MVKFAIFSIAAVPLIMACGVDDRTFASDHETHEVVVPSMSPTEIRPTETTVPPSRVPTMRSSTVIADASDSEVEKEVTAIPSPTPTPLDVVVPPCIPFPGSDVDPCERRDWWDDFTPHIKTTIRLPEVMSTFQEDLLNRAENPDWALHFAVRATAVPGSVRCGPTDCYVDLAVNEYLFGDGPVVVTATMSDNPSYYAYVQESRCGEQCIEDGAELIRATGIEGVEWIMLLGGPFPYDLTKNAWGIGPTYDLQLRQDGTVVVVHRYKKLALANSTPHNYALNLSRLEWTLDEFRAIVSDAYAAFLALTDGRTGTLNDWAGNPPPKLATDAGPAGFNGFFTRRWLFRGLPQPPPPVPGENDPNPDGLRIQDIIATRVAVGNAE